MKPSCLFSVYLLQRLGETSTLCSVWLPSKDPAVSALLHLNVIELAGNGGPRRRTGSQTTVKCCVFFQPLIKSFSVQLGGDEFSNLLSLIAGPHPARVRRSPLSLLSLLHIQASSHPSSPSAGAGRPQKRWLDSREAPILQPRQSRLHRWVTIGKARASLSPLSCLMRSGRRRLSEIMWSCVRDCFFCLFVFVVACLLFLASLMCAFFM